ncbi:MAG: hypothetical protein ACKPKO_02320 [Candidatus Fonsibacter sp.]
MKSDLERLAECHDVVPLKWWWWQNRIEDYHIERDEEIMIAAQSQTSWQQPKGPSRVRM